MSPRLALVLVFLCVSAEDEPRQPATGGLGFLGGYAEGIVASVAPRPFPEEVIDDLLIEGNVKKEETYMPYVTTILRLPIVILFTTIVFTVGYTILLCIACICCTRSPGHSTLIKNLYNGLLCVSALSCLLFAVLILYAAIMANGRLALLTDRLDHYAGRTNDYIEENCKILKNIAKEDGPQILKEVKSKLSKNINELAANLAEKIEGQMSPLMGKVDTCVAALSSVSSQEVTELFQYLDGIEKIPEIGGAAGPIATLIKFNLRPIDTDFDKLEQFRGLHIRKDADSRLVELKREIQKKSDNVLNSFDDTFKKELDANLVNDNFCGFDNEISAKIKGAIANFQDNVDYMIYFDYPNKAALAFAAIVVIITVLALFAIGVECVQTNSKTNCFPSKWLYQGSLCLALTSMFFLAAFGTFYFVIFGVTTDIVCDPWRNPESRPEMIGAVDKLLKRHIDQNHEFELSEILENVKNPFAETVKQCSDEVTMVKILKLADRFSVDDHKINDNLYRLERDVKQSLVPPQSARFGAEYFKDLKTLRRIDQAKVDENLIASFKTALGPRYNNQAKKAIETMRKLEKLIDTLLTNVPAASEVDDFLRLSGAEGIQQVADPFISQLLTTARKTVDELLSTVKSTVEAKVANCGKFARITNDLRTEICGEIVDLYNVVWLGFFHIVLFFVPFVVFAGPLATMPDAKRGKMEAGRKAKKPDVESASKTKSNSE